MPGTSSINGVVSGMDTAGIIDKLLELEKAPVTRLQTQKSTLNDKLTAWQDANTRILALKTKVDTLANSSTYDTKLFSTSDDSILTGTASSSAQSGIYYLKVNQLARAHQLKSEGYADINLTQVGTGKISISTGTGVPKDIVIDSSNNTLTGIKDAINKAGTGVKASIVNDGSGANAYRLVLTSNTSGSSGAITVNSTLTGGTTPVFTTMQAAQDALVTMGEGAGAVTISRSTNTISDLIPGVTVNLAKVDTTKSVTITVNSDTSTLAQNVKDFVQQYNNIVDFVNSQFKYDTSGGSGGPLFADSDLQSIQSDLSAKMFSPISGIDGMAVLSQIGVTTDNSGKLSVDETQLNDALANNLTDVKKLFSTMGDSSNSNIKFVIAGAKTVASGSAGYNVDITSVATPARVTSGVSINGTLTKDEHLTINNRVITLTAGMTQAQVVDKINESSGQTGVTASLTDASGQGTDNYLTLTRTSFGSGQVINVSSDVSGAGSTGFADAQNKVTAGVQQAKELAADETLTINGTEIKLTKGMSQQAVASAINAHASTTGVVASWTAANGTGSGQYLTLTSPGAARTISVVSNTSNSGSTATTGIGNVAVTQNSPAGENGLGVGTAGTGSGEDGLDVVGTINGESATGKGQILTGNSGNRTTDGLAVSVSGSAAGSSGTVTVTKGLASALSDYLSFVTEPLNGLIGMTEKSLQDQMSDIDTDITAFQEKITAKQEQLTTKFAAMEAALGKLKSEGDYITSQAATLSANWGSKK